MQNETRNMIAFVVVAALLMMAYQAFIVAPQAKLAAERVHAQAQAAATLPAPGAPGAAPSAPATPSLSRPAALALSPRVTIDTPSLRGSIALKGARLDDLYLKQYHEQVEKTSPEVELLRPEGMAQAYFAEQGWTGAGAPGAPTPATVWTLSSGGTLTPERPVVLTYVAPNGLTFTRQISVDAQSMFTISDSVTNTSAAPVTLAPYVSVQRQGLPDGLNKSGIVHEGAVGMLGEDRVELRKLTYKDWKKKSEQDWRSKGGWLGITDKYWMTTFVPSQTEVIDAKARVTTDPTTGIDIYETSYVGQPRAIAPGAKVTETNHLFAGAKVVPVLKGYGKTLAIPYFEDSIDWGMLWFLTKPFFALIEFLHSLVGNFGIALLMTTVVIRLLTFPLAHSGFEMGVKMKKVQPEIVAMQKRLKDDPAAQQKEMMALYAREKVNPITGCIPVFFQIPVFYALTKVFTVTIEMRHTPFFGWIQDMSARDPTTALNLFGLIPWNPAMTPLIGSILDGPMHVGGWPLLYGASMYLTQSMSPQTGVDPTQQMMFKMMPFIFTFVMAQYTVGLLIYWTWSSFLTIAQQYVMMRRYKVSNPIDEFFARFSGKPSSAAT